MNHSAPPPTPPAPAPFIALAMVLGIIAVLACGIPFVPPLVVVAVPLASASLLLLGRVMTCGTTWTMGRAMSAALALALTGFALYLALGRHHLIDWLEGH